jgi:hypothetical protein
MKGLNRAVPLSIVLATVVGVACHEITRPITPDPDARHSFLTSPGGGVVVSPGNMNGWAFADDRADTSCTQGMVCALVDGPAGTPLGTGSAELATPAAADAKALVLVDYPALELSDGSRVIPLPCPASHAAARPSSIITSNSTNSRGSNCLPASGRISSSASSRVSACR